MTTNIGLSIQSVVFHSERPRRGAFSSLSVISPIAGHVDEVALYPNSLAKGHLEVAVTVSRRDGTISCASIKARLLTAQGVVGGVQPVTVAFTNDGATATVIARVENSIAHATVGRHDIKWEWFASTQKGGVWRPMNVTAHTIYTTIDRPQPPWGAQKSAMLDLPWREILDIACEWARGASTGREVKQAITTAVRGLPLLRYSEHSSSYTGSTGVSNPPFYAARFLELLSSGYEVNEVGCSDLATIVTTFANILGADLTQDQMTIQGKTAPVLGLNKENFEALKITYHEVAWNAPGLEGEPLWDASLTLRGSAGVVVPLDMPFHTYRPLLMGDAAPEKCAPTSCPGRRRSMTVTVATDWQISIASLQFNGWQLTTSPDAIHFEAISENIRRVYTLWTVEQQPPVQRFTLEVYEFGAPLDPAPMFQAFVGTEAGAPSFVPFDIGDQAIGAKDESIIWTLVGRRAARLRSGGVTRTSVRPQSVYVANLLPTL